MVWYEILASIFYGLQAFGSVAGPLVAIYVCFFALDVTIFAAVAARYDDPVEYWRQSVWPNRWKYLDLRYWVLRRYPLSNGNLPARVNDGNAVVERASTTPRIASRTPEQEQFPLPPDGQGGGNAADGVVSSVSGVAPPQSHYRQRDLQREPVDSTNDSAPGEVALPGSSTKCRRSSPDLEAGEGEGEGRVVSSGLRHRNFSHPFQDGD